MIDHVVSQLMIYICFGEAIHSANDGYNLLFWNRLSKDNVRACITSFLYRWWDEIYKRQILTGLVSLTYD